MDICEQVINKILTAKDVDLLLKVSPELIYLHAEEFETILNHYNRYKIIIDIESFRLQYTKWTYYVVNDASEYLLKAIQEEYVFRESKKLLESDKLKEIISADALQAKDWLIEELKRIQTFSSALGIDIMQSSEEFYQKYLNRKDKDDWFISTGFKELDSITNGLTKGEEFFVIVSTTGSGKEQPLDSKILTPNGWTTMGEVKIGDIILAENGDETKIVNIFPQGIKDVYRLTFNDGTYAESGLHHLWKVKINHSNKSSTEVLTLNELITEMIFNKGVYSVPHINNLKTFRKSYREIISIERVRRAECQCIMVDHPSHTYITDNYTVTHNSWLALNMCKTAFEENLNVGFISPEMSPEKVAYRLFTLISNFSQRSLLRGEHIPEFKEFCENIKNVNNKFMVATPIDFDRRITVSKIKNFIIENKLDIICIDGLSYIHDDRAKRTDNKQQAMSNISEDLMMLSVELKIPVIGVVQSNRQLEKGEMPSIDNIRDSSAISFNATKILSLRQRGAGIEMSLLKNREGQLKSGITYFWDYDKGIFKYIPNDKDGFDKSKKDESIEELKTEFDDDESAF